MTIVWHFRMCYLIGIYNVDKKIHIFCNGICTYGRRGTFRRHCFFEMPKSLVQLKCNIFYQCRQAEVNWTLQKQFNSSNCREKKLLKHQQKIPTVFVFVRDRGLRPSYSKSQLIVSNRQKRSGEKCLQNFPPYFCCSYLWMRSKVEWKSWMRLRLFYLCLIAFVLKHFVIMKSTDLKAFFYKQFCSNGDC
jgi:hypothetical protein